VGARQTPITFDVFLDLGLFVTRYRGTVSDADFRGTYARIRPSNPAWLRLDELADMRAMTRFAVAHTTLRSEAELAGRYLAEADVHVRCAVVAPEDLPFALSRVYGAHADFAGQEDVNVFRDRDSAGDWLGVPDWRRPEVFAGSPVPPPAKRGATTRYARFSLRIFRSPLRLASKG